MYLKYSEKIKQKRLAGHFSLKRGEWKKPAAFLIFIYAFTLFSSCASIPVPKVEKVPIHQFQAYNLPDGTKIYPESIDDTIPDVDILAINHDIKSLLDDRVIKIKNSGKRMEVLKDILFQKVRYDTLDDSYGVKTAQETFDTGTGNCLSFSNLFIAMARYAGLEAKFQEIPTLPNWTRDGEVLFFTRHIGVSIDTAGKFDQITQLKMSIDNDVYIFSREFTRYFLLPSTLSPGAPDVNPLSFHEIPDYRAFAQYYNNIGSKRLAEGKNAEAFRYYVKAIKTDPELSFAWSNLGVIYRRNKQFDAAETAYFQGFSVTRGPRDTSILTIMSNLARLYDLRGDTEKVAFYESLVASFREKNPYYQYAAAKTAYNEALYKKSVKRFEQAIRLKDDEHLFYYGLALTSLKMGNIKKAEKNISLAIRYSRNDEKKAYYEQVRDIVRKSSTD